MDVLIVGSIAYDSITSPKGSSPHTLGGSATYAGLAASFHSQRLELNKVGLVGVVGTDFRKEDFAILSNAGLDTTGVEVVEGSTFHWVGSYHGNMAQAETHETHLNVSQIKDCCNTPRECQYLAAPPGGCYDICKFHVM